MCLTGRRILVVEDEENWREFILPALLEEAKVDGVCDVAAALQYLDAHPDQIDLVVVDVFLKNSVGTGIQVLQAAERRGIPALVFTSAPEYVRSMVGAGRRKPVEVVDKGSIGGLRLAIERLIQSSLASHFAA